jgi:uncharacterized protein with FMN-binding domain
MSKAPTHSLGRRLLPAVAMTAAASGLIGLLDRPSNGIAGNVGGGLAGGATALPDQGSPAVQGQPPAVSSTLPAVPGANNPVPTVGGDNGGQPAQPAATTTPPAAAPTVAPASSGPCTGKTVDGPSVNTRWGPVQVEAVISSSGQICDVGALRSPNDRRRSISINQEALPLLHDQVMKAQSTKIRGVSGATVTSEGYVSSLQAILDGTAG